jgi:hypothetical protein
MNALKSLLLYSLIVAVVCTCGTYPLAGGTSDTGNPRIVAVVYKRSGAAAVGASVTVCPKDYTPAVSGDAHSAMQALIKRTTTDSAGRFAIDSIENGIYAIEVNDRESCATLLETDLSHSAVREIELKDTLQPYAGIEGNAGGQSSTGRRVVVAYGLDRRIAVDSLGRFSCGDLPYGTFRFGILSSDSGFVPTVPESLTVTSGKTTSAPFLGWGQCVEITLNTTPSGADIAAPVFGFPALVRLTKDNFNFGRARPDGGDCRFVTGKDSPLPFEIERWDSGRQTAEIWVKLDTVLSNSAAQRIVLHYGNPNAAALDGSVVFDTGNGFQGVWHLSETKFDSAFDATNNHFQSSVRGMNDGSIVDGMIGRARNFDGVSSSILIQNSMTGKLNFPQNGHYTVSAWVYQDSPTTSSQVLVSKGDEQYFLEQTSIPSLGYYWQFVEIKDFSVEQVSKYTVTLHKWTLVSAVQNGADQFIYIDGQLVDSTPHIISYHKSRYTNFNVAIGTFLESDTTEITSCFHGIIDEVRIQSASLSPEWIRLCFMNQRTDDKFLQFQKLNN